MRPFLYLNAPITSISSFSIGPSRAGCVNARDHEREGIRELFRAQLARTHETLTSNRRSDDRWSLVNSKYPVNRVQTGVSLSPLCFTENRKPALAFTAVRTYVAASRILRMPFKVPRDRSPRGVHASRREFAIQGSRNSFRRAKSYYINWHRVSNIGFLSDLLHEYI